MWNDATYAVSEDEEASTVAGNMGFGMVPQGDAGPVGQVEGWTYLIPAYSENQEAAFLFIQWMMEFDQQLRQHLNGGASARPDVYAHADVQALAYSQGLDGHERGRHTKADDPRIAADHRYPRARDQQLSVRPD